MTTLLIDADIVAFKAAAASENPVNWGEGLWTLHAFEDDVKRMIDADVSKLQEQSGCDEVISCITGDKNFRKSVASYYKANRKDTRKPLLLKFAKDYMFDTYNGMIEPALEADDVLGILGSSNLAKYIIWSIDKDLMTIPAMHLIDGEIVEISKEAADYAFYKQVLTGDSTDNYKGCPSVGDKKADKVLELGYFGDPWKAIVKEYKKQGLSEKVAIENARLARILRHGEYNFKTKTITLWKP